jgi:hypothetical protein
MPWVVHHTASRLPGIYHQIVVIDSRVRRKKSRGGVGVFQYADTVEDGAWKDAKSQREIQVRY